MTLPFPEALAAPQKTQPLPLTSGQRPGLQDVAHQLRLSARTLQRRLTGERAKFQRLMEEARRQLARHCLLHSSLELKGYRDAKSLPQRFTNGEGISPGD